MEFSFFKTSILGMNFVQHFKNHFSTHRLIKVVVLVALIYYLWQPLVDLLQDLRQRHFSDFSSSRRKFWIQQFFQYQPLILENLWSLGFWLSKTTPIIEAEWKPQQKKLLLFLSNSSFDSNKYGKYSNTSTSTFR